MFLDRDPKYFEYVLSYLRNGRQFPPLPTDEAERERVREEFVYFFLADPCPTPQPNMPWVQQLRESKFTMSVLSLRMLLTAGDNNSSSPEKVRLTESALSEDGSYLVACYTHTNTTQQQYGPPVVVVAGYSVQVWKLEDGNNDNTANSMAPTLVLSENSSLAPNMVVQGLSMHGHELLYTRDAGTLTEQGTLIIVDVRKPVGQHLVQAIMDSSAPLRTWRARCNIPIRTSLSATHAAAYVSGSGGALWVRSTGQCVRIFEPNISTMLLRGDRLVYGDCGPIPGCPLVQKVWVYRTSPDGNLTLERRFSGIGEGPQYLLQGDILLQLDIDIDDDHRYDIPILLVSQCDISTGKQVGPVYGAFSSPFEERVHASVGGKLCWSPYRRDTYRLARNLQQQFHFMDPQTGAVTVERYESATSLGKVLWVPTDSHTRKRLVFQRIAGDNDELVVYSLV